MPRGGSSSTALPQRHRRGGTHKGPSKNKIVIRPYQKPPTLPAHYYEETAALILQGTVSALKTSSGGQQQQQQLSLQNAYQACVNLVSHQYGPRLYKDLVATLQEAAVFCLPSTASSNSNDSELLEYIVQQYRVYTDYLLLLKHICLPLDSSWSWNWSEAQAVPAASTTGNNTSGSSSSAGSSHKLWATGLHVFLERLKELHLDVALYQQWLAQFLQDWNGSGNETSSNSSSATLQGVWYLFQDLGILPHLPLQRDLEEYWQKASRTWQQTTENYPLVQFLEFCHQKHLACTRQWRPWLAVRPWLWRILDQQLVLPHLSADYLLNPDFLFPVLEEHLRSSTTQSQQQQLSPVQQLWMLAGRLPGGQAQVAAALQKFARQQGLQIVAASAVPSSGNKAAAAPPPNNTVVHDLLQLQDALQRLMRQLPSSEAASTASTATTSSTSGTPKKKTPLQPPPPISLKSVWEEVVNVDVTPSIGEQLAKFLDQILRSNKKMDQYSNNDTSGGASDAWLQRIIAGLFVPLQAKDVFEAFYKRDLAKRLLWNRVVSMDVEKQICSLLKAECGAGYTSKMEGMFQDVEWSKETMLVYKQSTAGAAATATTAAASNVEVEVTVLTTGYWPVYPQYPNLQLPDVLKEPQEQFSNHYKTKYQGRRMTWQYALGHCVVRANGFAKPYELIVSLCQALVLLQFPDDQPRTLPQLLHSTGLEDRDEMERILQSLALGKDGTRILRKLDHDVEAGKKKKTRMNVDDRDTFIINAQFTSNSRRIRITNVMMKETKEEREKTVEAVSRDRLYLIDAVLVRIMKARKTVLHQALIPQVLEQVKVPAQPADVKKRIESLIEREYLERDAKDRNRYNYLA